MTTRQIISIMGEKNLYEEFVTGLDVYDANCTYAKALDYFYEEVILDDLNEDEKRIAALMLHTDGLYYECEKSISNNSYRVLTGSEADTAWDTELDNILEDCILPELPESAQRYFDKEQWINDAKMDSRGSALSPYDGCEYCETINGTEYFIYKQ